MPILTTQYRIFIASPSDTTDERDKIQSVIYDWNSVNSMNYKMTLQPVRWESDAIPDIGDGPQEVLNKQLLPKCDMLVGVFRNRIGTTTKNAESGTVEEINEFIKTNKPVILYFCNQLTSNNEIDSDQKSKLDDFKRSIKEKGIVWEYSTVEDLSRTFFKHLLLKINDLQNLPISPEVSENSTVLTIKRLKRLYNKASIDWNVYRPYVPYHKGTLDRLEQNYRDLFDIVNVLNEDDAKRIQNRLHNALSTLRYVIDSGRQGPGLFSAFWDSIKGEKEREKYHNKFFSLIEESINELKKDRNPK
jgi:hypothetical protein